MPKLGHNIAGATALFEGRLMPPVAAVSERERDCGTTTGEGGGDGPVVAGERDGIGGCKRLSTHRSYRVSRTHADLVVFMPAVNHVEGLICRWLLWTGINACSASHFVTANARPPEPPSLPPSLPLPPAPCPLPPAPRSATRASPPPRPCPAPHPLSAGPTFPNDR